MTSSSIRLTDVLDLARQLSPEDQRRLVEQIEQGLPVHEPLESLYGLWAGGEPMPSEEEIKLARREMWAGFGEHNLE